MSLPFCAYCARPLIPTEPEAAKAAAAASLVSTPVHPKASCPRCHLIYCDKECRRLDIAVHERWCEAVANGGMTEPLPFYGLAERYLMRARRIPCDAVEVKASPAHGKGVFAVRDLRPNEVVSYIPLDGVFSLPAPCGELPIDAETARQFRFDTTFDIAAHKVHPILDGSFSSPLKGARPHFMAHFANDACCPAELDVANLTSETAASKETIKALLAYWMRSSFSANSILVLNQQPAMLVTVKPVKAGEELTVTYGPGYWLQHAAAEPLNFNVLLWMQKMAVLHSLEPVLGRVIVMQLKNEDRAEQIAAALDLPKLTPAQHKALEKEMWGI